LKWYIDGAHQSAQDDQLVWSYTFPGPDQYDIEMRVIFEDDSKDTLSCTLRIGEANITVEASPPEGGTVEKNACYYFYDTATITATPDPCYIFQNWTHTGTVVSTDLEHSFTVTENKHFVANFVKKTIKITNKRLY
jgi:hypothetical protein